MLEEFPAIRRLTSHLSHVRLGPNTANRCGALVNPHSAAQSRSCIRRARAIACDRVRVFGLLPSGSNTIAAPMVTVDFARWASPCDTGRTWDGVLIGTAHFLTRRLVSREAILKGRPVCLRCGAQPINQADESTSFKAETPP
jgi:hypothetical protein